jgi:hypothetical protein
VKKYTKERNGKAAANLKRTNNLFGIAYTQYLKEHFL